MLLKQTFREFGLNAQPDEEGAMTRALHDDMMEFYYQLETELSALPDHAQLTVLRALKENLGMKIKWFEVLLRKERPYQRRPASGETEIRLRDLLNGKEPDMNFIHDYFEMPFLRCRIKRAVSDAKLAQPGVLVRLKLLPGEGAEAVINAMARSVVSDWGEVECV